MEQGTIQHYHPEEGFGFLSTEGDGVDETKMVYFHISNCNIQTPPPRAGERVVITRDLTSRKPVVSALYRFEHERIPVSNAPIHDSEAPQDPVSPPPTSRLQPVSPARQARGAMVHSERSLQDSAPALVEGVITDLDEKRMLLEDLPSFYYENEGGKRPRYVYVDLDYMWTSYCTAEHILSRFPGATSTRDLEFHLKGFTRRVAMGEPGSTVARLVAFYAKTPEWLVSKLRRINVEGVYWDVRKEVDSCDAAIQWELRDVKPHSPKHEPNTLVLVMGKTVEASTGFVMNELLDRFRDAGWSIEIHAWLSTMAINYITYQRECPETIVVRPFDDGDVGEIICLCGNGKVRHTTSARQNSHRQAELAVSESPEAFHQVKSSREPSNTHAKVSMTQPQIPHREERSPTVSHSRRPHQSTHGAHVAPRYANPTASTSNKARHTKHYNTRQQAKVGGASAGHSQRQYDTRSHRPQYVQKPMTRSTGGKSTAWGVKTYAQAVGRVDSREAHEVRATSHTTRLSNTPMMSNPVSNKAAERLFHPEQFAKLIRLLDEPDGEMYIPSGLAMLEKLGVEGIDSIRHTDTATQRLLLSVALNDEMDTMTRRDLYAEENPVY